MPECRPAGLHYSLIMETISAAIAQRLGEVRSRIGEACVRAGRGAREVTLVGVTKGVAAATVADALGAGLNDIGENVVQEARAKKDSLGAAGGRATWHMIGHLQTNKVKTALSTFDAIHSLDSLHLAREIDRRASERVRVLIEVNVGGEATKFGFAPAEVGAAVTAVGRLPHLDLVGLMTVAPAVADPQLARPFFRELRELARANGLRELSMGMSNDFETAIEEGATIVRIGRAIFGERRP